MTAPVPAPIERARRLVGLLLLMTALATVIGLSSWAYSLYTRPPIVGPLQPGTPGGSATAQEGSQAQPSSTGPSRTDGAAAFRASVLTGTWEGSYTCAQGETGLRLTMTAREDGSVDAQFAFFALPANPNVPSGSFSMVGSHAREGLTLTQSRWIDQPPGYAMIDLNGDVPADDTHLLEGSVSGSDSCTTFSLRKTSTRAEASPPASEATNGDLGLGVPMSSPTCDGTWIVFLGAATDAARYSADVRALLDSHPGSMYTLTRGGCSSMRQQLPDGSLIYAVYTGPYPDQAAACAARAQVGGGAYVKRMDNVTPAEQLWEC